MYILKMGLGKCSLFFINYVIMFIGILTSVVCSVGLYYSRAHVSFLSEGILTIPIIGIVFGVFMVLVGGIGFFGSLARKAKFLYIYGSLSTASVIL